MSSIVEDLKLGFRIALRNWPLILISIAESILAILLVIGALLLVAAPFVISIARGSVPEIDRDPAKIAEWILGNWMLLLAGVLAVFVALLLAMVVHSFVEAGRIAIYERSRVAGGAAVFTPELWMDEGRRGWLQLFLIYNAVWGLFSLIFLIPIVMIVLLAAIGQHPALVMAGCLMMALFFAAAFVLGIASFLWSQMASIEAVVRRLRTADALSEGWKLVKQRLGPLLAIVFIIFVLSASISSFVGIFAFLMDLISGGGRIGIALLPLRVGLQILQSVISVIFSSWLLGALVASVGGLQRSSIGFDRNLPLR